MSMNKFGVQCVCAVFVLICFGRTPTVAQELLPSWNDGSTRQAIIAFVEKVTAEGTADYVPPAQRIATFDNDGCLWSEQPVYAQAAYIFDRIQALAPQHPEWKTKEPFASVLKGDLKKALSTGEKGLMELAMATHAGMTSEEFEEIVTDWIATATHPKTGRHYNEMVYQPMLELLDYLRANEFKTFIVSGGGIDFMRPWTSEAYGIPPEQVVGSSVKTIYEVREGVPVIARLPEINFIDDKAGKPIGIQQHIGQRPIFAAGNSDGDFEMLEWTTSGKGPRFALYVHHTDDDREVAYDRDSHIGKLDRGLDEGKKRGWTFVDMKNDWKQIFPDLQKQASIYGKWVVEDIGGQGVVDNAYVTMTISEDGGVTGSSTVNRFNGTVTLGGSQISFGPMAMTRRAGPAALMRQEADYMTALQKVAAFRIERDGLLCLLDKDSNILVRLNLSPGK